MGSPEIRAHVKRIKRRHLLAWIAATVLLAGALALLVPASDWSEALESALEERNRLPAMLLFGAAYVAGSLLLLPAWIFQIAAGAAFGPAWGLLAAIVSATVAAVSAFLIARHLLRGRVEAVARRDETFVAVERAVKREPWIVVALLRLSPVLPSGLKSYFLGLTCVRPLTYALATALGMLPGIAIKVALGHFGRGALDPHSPWKWALLAAGLAATAGFAFIVGRAARKRLRL